MNTEITFKLPTIENINKAYTIISTFAHITPVMKSEQINQITCSDIFFKCENFQKGGAFKIRGAINAVKNNIEDCIKYGITTHSSGNHAQAVAIAGKIFGIKTHIVMPKTASKVKIDAVKSYGANIEFCKPTLEDRESSMERLINQFGYRPIHAYNDIRVITGQATATLEFFNQLKQKPDYIILPVGGGGLLSGAIIASHYLSPETKVIGAEPEMANDAYLSFKSKKFIPSVTPNTIADGLKTSLGSFTFPIIINKVYDILTVSEDNIIKAMRLIWERMKIIIEPSSAVGLAAIMENKSMFRNKKTAVILSGGNIDLMNIPWMK